MYTEQDYEEVCAQFRRRRMALLIPCLVMAAAVIASFVLRIRWLTTVLTIVTGAGCIFCWSMFLAPVRAYRRHLDEVLHGRVRSATGVFKEMEEKAVLREGVRYFPLMINVGDMDNPEDDRLFYYDANLPRPDWQRGEMITVTAHDKALGAWARA